MSKDENQSSQLPLPLVEQILENQTRELVVRAQEVELEKQKDENAFAFSKEALAAQAKDREHARECRRNEKKDQQKMVLWLFFLVGLLIFGVTVYGAKDLALELAKAIILLAAGASGGYGIATARQRRKKDED
ncbi:MAG: hypothetical protein Q4B94_04430 [Pseudomonadota bacterium]|nr:hypothetical protein [Pseudomonadota bacterium]